ncbi:thiosulfate sulfurtransferase GlpE [Azovibrio restrictus]|uniref:thiosulfate sulfurtransferase GlpE n=1 Tax=Azovibrio restrictus TaxID=146938 RepID=UPI00042255D3|nr:thiosulfate sulfurtransferase GlpE [Azovibrio restrictus]
MTQPAYLCIPGAEAARLIRDEPGLTLFDVRDARSYRSGHAPGAAHLDETRLAAWMQRLPRENPVLIYCYQGQSSQAYARMFADFRYSRVYSVDGGYPALLAALAADA